MILQRRKKIMQNSIIRPSLIEDKAYLIQWLDDPAILRGFPMCTHAEVVDAANIWISYCHIGATLTACIDDIPVGVAGLYIQPFKKLAHQSLFAIIVDKNHRNKGIGKKLIMELEKLAKEKFHIEMLHLEVYKENPALKLYERLGFIQYAVHEKFLKEASGEYFDKIMMYKLLKEENKS